MKKKGSRIWAEVSRVLCLGDASAIKEMLTSAEPEVRNVLMWRGRVGEGDASRTGNDCGGVIVLTPR